MALDQADCLTVNGTHAPAPMDRGVSLATFLRDGLGLQGTKIGCAQGECGACTVMVDGRAVCACLYPSGRAIGRRVETIEGLDDDPLATRLRDAMIERGAFQCGFCTPGVIVSLTALFRTVASPNETAIRAALQGNVCRCSGYTKLLEAARAVARATA